ncbi:hypothetical protein JJB99_23445 [Bradyrhizobium diazoefficiens]|uniref:hypothetical protein n=1 Tax=Bradyrhizobium diazoefficiens TaxID=1355477 RepID=UPI00190C9CF2|nr:hypothetical protein [Bradyrhizobium diazoefficiens]QQO12425.1 hypothetical protein JJB99_23445 [Bradyrhizobium diazoefficiens]
MNRSATDASTVKAAGAHAAAAATGVGVVWDKACGQKNERRDSSEKITKHGVSSIDWGALIRFSTM